MAVLGFARKRDLVYFIHFCMSIPIMFLMDLQALYPPSLVPAFMENLKSFYINTYNDQFFINTPLFFKTFMWTEILYQAPVSLWAIPALLRNDPKVPVVLLPFATLVFLTTLTCVVDMWSWSVPLEQKIELSKLYGPYLVLPAYMGVDMCLRLLDTIKRASATSAPATKKSQ
ncbi:related to integral membrane protein [Phialocephala subalpina]|uniref:Efficient mitochondria targeting-associated protein 19 n=1 Tax=Phialocephala subalpina TaxID=576137 RepID=A0A1L7XC89_9HELO|nr:related to integral membrane protein [Phialocephala subalpina]